MSLAMHSAGTQGETQVLIAGAGPVGLTLAIDLAWRGVDVTVIEPRPAGEPPRIRSNHVSIGIRHEFSEHADLYQRRSR